MAQVFERCRLRLKPDRLVVAEKLRWPFALDHEVSFGTAAKPMIKIDVELQRLVAIERLQSEAARLQSVAKHHTIKDEIQHVKSDLAAAVPLLNDHDTRRPTIGIDLTIKESAARLQAVAYALKTQGPTATFIGETVWACQDRA